MPHWTLEITLTGERGDKKAMCVQFDPTISREYEHIRAPIPELLAFEEGVALLKRREFRKDLLIQAATDIGTKLAEVIEDSEGWYGVEREEKATQALRRASLSNLSQGDINDR